MYTFLIYELVEKLFDKSKGYRYEDYPLCKYQYPEDYDYLGYSQ
jgi:hypothetical protein